MRSRVQRLRRRLIRRENALTSGLWLAVLLLAVLVVLIR
jgi:hypothetical protein